MKLRGLVPDSYILVYESDLYIPTIGPPFLLQQNRRTERRNIYVNRTQTQECGSWEQGRPVSFWEYNNRILFAVYYTLSVDFCL
jgi:hypothetical protein